MLHTSKQHPGSDNRSGIVLLVVMAMLALFSTVALSFVFYAEAEATISRYTAQAQTQSQADIDPETLLSYFLSQAIYDTDNPYSAMRGHSLARNMYGQNPNDVNVVPFNGLGRMRFPVTIPGVAQPKNNAILVNYQYPLGAQMRNPETDANGRYVGGNVHWTYPDLNNMFLAAVNGNGEVLIPSFHRPWLGVNPPFSGVDPNASNPAAKYMTLRPHVSYHTQFTTPDWDGGGDVKNLEWGPGQRTGDPNKPPYYNNDSIWMDLGFPVQTAPNGKRYKPLFAPLIVDMDNKINLFVHGNIMKNGQHFSNMGYGWWEVNLSKVLNEGNPSTGEWQKLFTNSPIGRYGPNNGTPDSPPATGPLNQVPPYWSKVDYGGQQGNSIIYPGIGSTSPFNSMLQTYPDYPNFWDNGTGNDSQSHAAGYNPAAPGPNDDKIALVMSHIEALYRFLGTNSPAMTSDLLANMPKNFLNPSNPQAAAKIRWLSTLRSMDLDRPGLMAYNWNNMIGNQMVGNQNLYPISDYQYVPFQQYSLFKSTKLNPVPPYIAPPQTKMPSFPPNPPAVPALPTAPLNTLASGEFNLNGLRSNVYNHATLVRDTAFQPQLRILLNRPLTPYPVANPGTGLIDSNAANNSLVQKAVMDRTNLASDIYNMLVKLTGIGDPRAAGNFNQIANNTETNAVNRERNKNAARWLAQLALNIVDFIDEDDYMTPWQWFPQATDLDNPYGSPEWLFGTELGHLLINEVYAQIDNDVQDNTIYDNKGKLLPGPKAKNYSVNFWVELHNPFKPPTAGANFPRDNGKAIIQAPTQNNYQIVLTTASNFNNISGNFLSTFPKSAPTIKGNFETPQPPAAQVWPDPLSAGKLPNGIFTYVDVPGPNPYSTTLTANSGFLVIGAKPPQNAVGAQYLPTHDPFQSAGQNTSYVTRFSPLQGQAIPGNFTQLSWVRSVNSVPDPRGDTYGVYLQRLANPNLPFNVTNADPTKYNPYVTVDYFNQINTTNKTLYDGIVYDKNGGNAAPWPPTVWNSWGRKQPYVGYSTPVTPNAIGNWVPQKLTRGPGPKHTFGQHNGNNTRFVPGVANDTLTTPFLWPAHLDRRLVSPVELLNVSCYGPWEFTQKFGAGVNQAGVVDDHRSPWDNQNTLLYRLLEMTQTPYDLSLTTDVPGGRRSGKININTIWDKEILDALVDSFAVDNASPLINRNLFQSLMDSRSPRVDGSGLPGPTDEIDFNSDGVVQPNGQPVPPTNMNRPFKSLNVGVYPAVAGSQYPNGLGIENTILRSDQNYQITPRRKLFGVTDNKTAYPPIPVSVPPVPQLPATPPNKSLSPDGNVPTGSFPFKTNELLSKIYNNTTTRSNVFAVWLTVGFFEVVDESVYPVKLGGEIGRGENRQIRHRMFSIIDRTNLMMPKPVTVASTPIAGGKGVKVTLKQTTWNLAAPGQVYVKPFSLKPGMSLAIDYDENASTLSNTFEVVIITAVNGQQITADFTTSHQPGVKVAAVLLTTGPTMKPTNPSTTRPWFRFAQNPLEPQNGSPPLPSPNFQIATPGSVPNSILGNPGPQEGYFDPRQNTLVVPYFSIIQ